MNKAIEAAAKSKSLLNEGLIRHMSNERLQELANAIHTEFSYRNMLSLIAKDFS